MAKLVLISATDPQEFQLAALNSIGRHPSNSIQILDRIISKEHARVLKTPDNRYVLQDLGSLNGTFVGEAKVSQHVLKDGDLISMGSTQLAFHDDTPDEFALQKVTFAPDLTQSHVRQRLNADEQVAAFRPEREISDEPMIRRDYERLRVAHELSRSIANELDLDKLLQKILAKAFELIPADRGVIMLMNKEGVPVPKVAKNRLGADTDDIILSNSIINEVLREKKALLSSDATMDSRFSGAHSIIMQGIRSTMCVPLLHGEEMLGIMHMDSRIATNAFNEKDLWVFAGVANQAAVAIQNAQLASKIEWEAQTRAQFQRFFSPALVEQMISGKLSLDSVGEMREVTILFADIRGFTAMTEHGDAHDIVSLLNEYFEVMVEVLFRYNGTLDKYVGDEIMALFGVPQPHEDATVSAVECALEMQRTVEEFNRSRSSEGDPPISVGIGINTGKCVYGAIGSRKTVQYTVIGDTVNTASRLCSLAKAGEIICGEATYQAAQHRVIADTLPKVKVKGKDKELSIYRVTGKRDDSWVEINTRPH